MRDRRKRSKVAEERGFKSMLEVKIAEELESMGYPVFYEVDKLEYVVPETRRKYIPDFSINGIYLEGKGRFTSEDRKKMLLVKKNNPTAIIYIIFERPHDKLDKRSKTTKAMWCDKNGFKWCDIKDGIPKKWLQ